MSHNIQAKLKNKGVDFVKFVEISKYNSSDDYKAIG